jgi:peptide/nickel transport system permease protein
MTCESPIPELSAAVKARIKKIRAGEHEGWTVVLKRRLLRLAAVAVLVTLLTSFMLELVPGSPAVTIAGEGASPEAIAAINDEYGFDKPAAERYLDWVGGILRGDLGESYLDRTPVFDAIKERAPVTFELALGAILLALMISLPLALFCAYRAGSSADRAVDAITSGLIAVPSFVTSLCFVYVFSVTLGWLPVTGWTPLTTDPVDNLRHAFIPMLALSLPAAAVFQRVLRADLVGTLQQDFITLARAKGASPTAIVVRHALRPSSFSVLTVAGIRLAELVGGTVVIETIFSIPGIGAYLVQSVLNSDLVAVQGIVLLMSIAYLGINFAVDSAYRLLDPRVAK